MREHHKELTDRERKFKDENKILSERNQSEMGQNKIKWKISKLGTTLICNKITTATQNTFLNGLYPLTDDKIFLYVSSSFISK